MEALHPHSFAVRTSLALVACGLLAAHGAAATTRYATPSGGASTGACESWAAACTLPAALTAASSGDEVWVAAGVYKPTATTDRLISFDIPPGVAVYGGFAGGETSREQRDPAVQVTVLSGDIDGNDTNVDGNDVDETAADIQGDNSYHVVTMDGVTGPSITATTVLDGFTITGGQANDDNRVEIGGGGLNCNAMAFGAECSPTLANLAFRGNMALGAGGAFYGEGNPTLTNVIFSGNTASNGGGMYSDSIYDSSSPTLTHVTFSGNSADTRGGGMYNHSYYRTSSSPTLTDVTFDGNTAGDSGGAMVNDGHLGTSSPSLTNVTFSGNKAGSQGGAMMNDGYDNSSSPTLTNVTFRGNSAGSQGGAIVNYAFLHTNVPIFTNVVLWGNTASGGSPEMFNDSAAATLDHSVVAACPAGATCSHLVTTDPLLGPLQDNGGLTQTIALGVGSSAIGAADDGACPATDQRGVARPQGKHCDVGAYELDTTAPAVTATSLQATYVTSGPSSFTVTFSEPVNDPAGDGGTDDVTNPANYLLVEAGANGAFDTLSCDGGVVVDDTQVPVAGVTYGDASLTATLSLGRPLPLGAYRLFVCGTTSITDLAGTPLGGGSDAIIDLAVLPITAIPALGPRGLALLGLLLAAGALAFLRRS